MCDVRRPFILLQTDGEALSLSLGRVRLDIFVFGQCISGTVDIHSSHLICVGRIMIMRPIPVVQGVWKKAKGHRGIPDSSQGVQERRSKQLLKGRETNADEGDGARDTEEARGRIKDGNV